MKKETKISTLSVVEQIIKQPTSFTYFDLDKFDGEDIADVLEVHPNLIKIFNLTKMDGYDISRVIVAHPSTYPEFDLSKLNSEDWDYVKQHRPTWMKYFRKD